MRTPSSPHGTAAWLSVVRAYHLCERVMSARLAPLGVKLAEHEVLANLSTAPGITQQVLAARSFNAKSHVSMLLKQMEAQGLVRREANPADARAKCLFLTEAGTALARQTMKVQAEVVSRMAAPMTVKELDLVEKLMTPASEVLQAMLDEGP
ncbi:MAG TPA: MarR family winged helix-turn-helix transcriptional regulator [Rhizobacter sp.]|nr:MarR family winged helix-turn-helix transcriptional regulator [Rhizobacter sp.]